MPCSDCFNGCAGTTSDKCVKYNGVDVPELNIEKGDSLFSVEDNIILKILSMIIGEGILPEIAPENICAQMQTYLPVTTPYTLNDYLTAVIRTACVNGASIVTINNTLSTLNSNYILDCIVGVAPENINNTHVVVQAIIDNFCTLKADVEALALNLSTNYIPAGPALDAYIAAYLASTAPSNLISNKMIPFVAVEYYGTLANFNGSGAGIGDWVKVYLCNGANGTPDKRGVTPVGVTNVLGGGAYNPKVDPAITGNPTYVLAPPTITGSNTVTLTEFQLPPHTHTATVNLVEPPHSHNFGGSAVIRGGVGPDAFSNSDNLPSTDIGGVQSNTTGITVSVTNSSTGAGDAHSNIQPVLPCYYIMYIP